MLTGTAEAGSTVEAFQNGGSIGTEIATGGTWTLLVMLDEGVNTFTAAATDAAGNTSDATDAVIITLDSTAPGVSITSTPQSVNTESFTLTGTAEAGSTVEVFQNGGSIGTEIATGGTWTLLVMLDEGVNTFTAAATDAAGNTSDATDAVIITLDSTAPGVSITSTPQSVNTESFTLTGTAEAGSIVEVFQNGGSIGTETATGGTWTLLVMLDEGVNTFTAAATDAAGNTSDATDAVIITLDSVASVAVPSISISTDTLVATVGSPIDAITIDSSGGGAVEGYSIAPTLPDGLALDETTGTISGIPTVASDPATYTITATNSGGTATATVNITVNDETGEMPVGSPGDFVTT